MRPEEESRGYRPWVHRSTTDPSSSDYWPHLGPTGSVATRRSQRGWLHAIRPSRMSSANHHDYPTGPWRVGGSKFLTRVPEWPAAVRGCPNPARPPRRAPASSAWA